MMFACSSDDLLEKGAVSNDQFSGIEKVDATFSMDEGVGTRFDGNEEKGIDPIWEPQEGDTWGFVWLGDGAKIDPTVEGIAYQNHNLIQKGSYFEPQTSIYVGKYYIYRPYDKTTVSPQAINFTSLEEQTISEGFASSTQAWKDLAKTAINIGPKWTVVTPGGWGDGTTTWDKAGIKQNYKLYAALFSNQTGLDVTYVKNNPAFNADKVVTGATDINFTCAAGSTVESADIYSGSLLLTGAANAFTYAPKASLESEDPLVAHDGGYWADQKNLGATEGFDFTISTGAINFTAKDAENGIPTGDEGSKGWFWLNTLPVTAGDGDQATVVTPIFETSYGQVTAKFDYDLNTNLTVGNCAKALNIEAGAQVWHPLSDAGDAMATPTVWALTGAGAPETFINQYGNHKGKFEFNLDFSKGVMNGMHIKNDRHLQKALKYYLASGKDEVVVLNLDKDDDNEFKISKISIALLQTINAGGNNVKVQACALDAAHTPNRIVVTQDGCSASETEVPALNDVFAVATDVYLANTDWTWGGNYGVNDDGTDALPIDGNVKMIYNEGTITVNATNIQTVPCGASNTIVNTEDGTMNITKVTTVKNNLRNLGIINVGAADKKNAELRAFGKTINNQATSLTQYGVINNYGVVGVTAGTTPAGAFNNYGLINMMNNDAITLLTSNEKGATPFGNAFNATTNKMGTVVLPQGNPYAIVSVSNAAENGFIKYDWDQTTYTHDAGNVKYNTIVVSNNITFTGDDATEIQFIEFKETNRALVVNPDAANKLPNLKGIIVDDNSSIIIEKTNIIDCSVGAYLGNGATVYRGGDFLKNHVDFVAGDASAANNYLGPWDIHQIVEY